MVDVPCKDHFENKKLLTVFISGTLECQNTHAQINGARFSGMIDLRRDLFFFFSVFFVVVVFN